MKRLWPLLLVSVLMVGCQKELLEASRGDICLGYTLPSGNELGEYKSSIDTLTWLVYDDGGRLVYQLRMTPRQYFMLDELPDGRYTVVCMANITGRTAVTGEDDLEQLMVKADTRQADGWYDNTDHLFWQMGTFVVAEGHSRVELPLADVHCHLHVQVRWKTLPRQVGNWTLRLYDVPLAYQAGMLGRTLEGLPHPLADENELGEHRIDVRLLNYELDGLFTTFRWTNAHIPALQVWCGDEPASPLMGLEKAFETWHWYPDRTIAQDYWLVVTIADDGTAEVKVASRFGVADWIDGGVIGG